MFSFQRFTTRNTQSGFTIISFAYTTCTYYIHVRSVSSVQCASLFH